MNHVVEQIPNYNEAKNAVEIVVHVSDTLDERKRNNVVAALGNEDGIVSAEFCPLHFHLMLVKYDRDQYTSQNVLSAFGAQKLQAKLIGPI